MTQAFRVVCVLLAASVVLAGCSRAPAARRPARGGDGPSTVPTATAHVTTIHGTSSIAGVIAPLQNVAITSQLVEPADVVAVNEGDHVHAGQLLAQLDTADLQAQLAQDEATIETDIRTAASDDAKVAQARYTEQLNIGQGGDQVQSARAAVAQAQQTLANDRTNLNRDQPLMSQGYIAQQTLDQQSTQVANDEAAVRTAQANLESAITNQQVNGTAQSGLQAADVASAVADARAAHATVDQARAAARAVEVSIAHAHITSPVDGVVVNRNLNPGEYPNGRTLFTVQELDHVYAELNASSSDTFHIPNGVPVSLSVAGADGQAYRGTVVAVLGQVAPGTTDFTVKVLLANPDDRLQSGLPVTATVSLPPIHGIGIPTTAFLDDTHTTVMLADDEMFNTVARTTHVHEIGSDGTTSIVTGLEPGDDVVSNGQLGLSDGQSLAEN